MEKVSVFSQRILHTCDSVNHFQLEIGNVLMKHYNAKILAKLHLDWLRSEKRPSVRDHYSLKVAVMDFKAEMSQWGQTVEQRRNRTHFPLIRLNRNLFSTRTKCQVFYLFSADLGWLTLAPTAAARAGSPAASLCLQSCRKNVMKWCDIYSLDEPAAELWPDASGRAADWLGEWQLGCRLSYQ